ncbi:DUF4136 domain-containing protein [Allosphingosinicella deserti]|uniref:DUF4136 domain-containing protein n=1 Tax=Allosphingosinicella deserti TaxID=2116704 RepID=A0A2P7QV18_9SPHN|nr:DUF4136 domain-containing protein [Sphingomonas deserti]PSJ41790.1 DUF4136 domain-containing protein [Sphingomonas deserti]
MKTAFLRGGAILLALAVSACASRGSDRPVPDGVDVARFHLGQATIAKAQIAIEPFDRADASRPEYPAVAAAVARELTRLGWTVAPAGGTSEQIALIDVEQGSRESIAALTAARIGRGIAPPAASGSSAGMTATLLEVGLRRRSDATVFWEGRAVAEAQAGSAEAAPVAAVGRLAPALFQDFPGESGRTIRIR